MLSKNFFLASAEIPFREFLKLSTKAKRKYIVLSRTIGGKEYHYVILRKALEEAMKTFTLPLESPTEVALNLHEYLSDPSIEVRGDPADWIQPALGLETAQNISVLKSKGRVVAVFDPHAKRPDATYEIKGIHYMYQSKLGAGSGGAPRGQSASKSGQPRAVVRHPPSTAAKAGSGQRPPPPPPSYAPPVPRTRGWPGKRAESPSAGALGELVRPPAGVKHERYPKATFPDRVALGREASLEVVIDAVQSTPVGPAISILALPGEKEVPVLAVVQPGTFEVVGTTAHEILVPVEPQKSDPAVFRLIAREQGDQVVYVRFYPRGVYAAQLAVKTRVVRTEREAQAAAPVTIQTPAKLREAPLGADLTLIIQQKSRNAGLVYDVGIWSHDLQIAWQPLGQITFPSDPDQQFRTFFSELERIRTAAPDAEERIDSAARNLYTNIVPEPLRRRYWALRDSIKTIQVVSMEPWIPWEILMPWDPDNPSAPNGQFLSEKHIFSRWLIGVDLPKKDQLQSVKVVAPPGANLPGAQKELRWIRKFGRQKGFSVTEAVGFGELLNSLKTEQFDVLHFSTHGRFDPAYPAASGLFLQDGIELRPDSLTGPNAAFGKANPLVVLNACQTGQEGFSFTRVAGWATSFLEAGACAFIGTQWSVNDQTAAEFTQALYEGLNRGDSLASAVRGARLAARHQGDPSWLAYQLYAYPNTVSKLGR
jgi:hypothetical protein